MKALNLPQSRCLARRGRPVFGSVACKATGCKLVGTGSSVPARILTNEDLAKLVDTNDEWITSRTGIKARRILSEGETITQHAVKASQNALQMAGINADAIDLVVLATSTPDDVFGGACAIQAGIGAKNATAFDLTAACSGFVLGLITAAQFVRCGTAKNVLIVGADAMSRLVDWTDRGTCILFGDGCGAVVMTASEDGSCSLLGTAAAAVRQLTCAIVPSRSFSCADRRNQPSFACACLRALASHAMRHGGPASDTQRCHDMPSHACHTLSRGWLSVTASGTNNFIDTSSLFYACSRVRHDILSYCCHVICPP